MRRGTHSQSGNVQSVERALKLLELVAQSARGSSLTELASRANLNISTCHHLLATLIKCGYIAKVPGRRTYAVGARVLHLGQAFVRQIDLPRLAEPLLARLNAATGEAVHLTVLQGDRVVTIAKIDARHPVRVDAGEIGSPEAPHATATGKALLVWLPEDHVRRLLAAHGMTRCTPATITSFDALVEEMRSIRRNGHALDLEEFQPGAVGIAAAVRDHAGAVIGAIGIAAPAFRAAEEPLAAMRDAVIDAAR